MLDFVGRERDHTERLDRSCRERTSSMNVVGGLGLSHREDTKVNFLDDLKKEQDSVLLNSDYQQFGGPSAAR